MKKVLGVDLASSSWASNGTAVLEFDEQLGCIAAVVAPALRWPTDRLTPLALADAIDAYVRASGVRAVAFDGPQGWRDPATPLGTPGVGRRCEYACRTQGKTGTYPRTYPATQRAWIEFCIDLFADLLARPNVILANQVQQAAAPAPAYMVLECYPTSAWRSSGLRPLPGKAAKPELAPYLAELSRVYGLPAPAAPVTSHDDLQAIVAALCAIPLVGGPAIAEVAGSAAKMVLDAAGSLRRVEGLIWNVRPLRAAASAPASSSRSIVPSDLSLAVPVLATGSAVRVTQRVIDQVVATELGCATHGGCELGAEPRSQP